MTHPIEKWYSGKALATIRDFVLPTLAEAERLGYWPKGTSRKVAGALNKANLSTRFAKREEKFLESLSTGDSAYDGARGWILQHVLYFNQVTRAAELPPIIAELRTGAKQWVDGWDEKHYRTSTATTPDAAALTAVLDTVAQWAEDFAPIGALVEQLDATRVPPTVVLGSLSPLVAKALGKVLEISFTSIRSPKYKTTWVWVEKVIGGRKVRARVAHVEIIWPAGTQHNRSRFAYGSHAGNEQCHACGHAIRDVYNWVPLVADNAEGTPLSLWVGRDCARKLFAVDVTGDAVYTNRSGS